MQIERKHDKKSAQNGAFFGAERAQNGGKWRSGKVKAGRKRAGIGEKYYNPVG